MPDPTVETRDDRARKPTAADLLRIVRSGQVVYGLDTASSVCFDGDRVFRLVQAEGAEVVRRIAREDLFAVLESYGVVATRLCSDGTDPALPLLVLEHERIPFVTHPAEWTPQMVREAARFLVDLSLKIHAHGLMIKDNHLLNVTFRRGRPVFLDFGSIVPYDAWLARAWLKGFRARVLTAVWAARWKGGRITAAMLRSEPRGLGYELSTTFPLNLVPPSAVAAKMMVRWVGWEKTLRFLRARLRDRKLRMPKNIWNDYGVNLQEEKALKRQVLLDEVRRSRPASVHELAGNQAVIGEEIAKELGIPVCASDSVAHCVQVAHARTRDAGLPLDVAVVDLLFPVPPYGIGSCRPGSAERLRADMTLATALIHHLVALKVVSMDSFVGIVAAYTVRSTIVEWVDPSDKYLVNWAASGKQFPDNYTLDGFLAAFGRVFPHCRELPRHHETRRLFHFSRTPLEECAAE